MNDSLLRKTEPPLKSLEQKKKSEWTTEIKLEESEKMAPPAINAEEYKKEDERIVKLPKDPKKIDPPFETEAAHSLKFESCTITSADTEI
jgi:hypothetical protein